jgi:hypothetical protein
MSDGAFNIAKGKIRYYTELPAASDALVVVLLKSTGLVADTALADYDDLAALLAGASDECDFTNYARKTVTLGVIATVDDSNDRVDVDMPDLTWTAAGGAANNTVGKLIVAYDPATGSGTDSEIIPLTFHDCAFTTDGTDVTAAIAAAGFFRAA